MATRKKKKKLPPDPEGANEQRSAWAEMSIGLFEAQTGVERNDALCDLLADLMHWCDRNDFKFEDELLRAEYHYQAETEQD